MKITANRKDDILKQMGQYDSEMQGMKDQIDQKEQAYYDALHAAMNKIEKRVSDMIGSTSLDLNIQVQQSWRMNSDRDSWEIDIQANQNKKFDDRVALAWNWKVGIDKDGNVTKDSGSWSGLKAISPEQIADLEESIRVLKILNNVDWSGILTSDLVNFYDYVDKDLSMNYNRKRKDRPDFEKDLIGIRLEELIDQNIAVELYKDAYYNGSVGMFITRVSDKFVTGYIFPMSLVGQKNPDELRAYAGEPRRTSRDNLKLEDGMLVELNIM